MRTTASFLRIFGFLILGFCIFEFILDTGDELAIEKYPILWLVHGFILLFAIIIEIVLAALQNILFMTLGKDAQERYLLTKELEEKNRFKWIKDTYKKLLGSKPIEEENEIILDHNYDGIKELDNRLPPWWVYGFYLTIIFAVIYMSRYHIFNDVNQDEEYAISVAQAKIEIEAYKKTAKNLVDVNTVTVLTDVSDLNAGKTIFSKNCIACHKADGGGGIGPNLTDKNWILGGGIKNVFNTVSEGGRDGKGMVAWKSELKPLEMAQVASYVLQFQGTTPAEPKPAEGTVWVDPSDTPKEVVKDTTQRKTPTYN